MKLLDKYILKEFIRFFLITCVSFIALYILIDLFEADTMDDPDFLDTVEKTKYNKRVMCAKRGYKYIGAIEDVALNYDEIEKQLKESEKMIKKYLPSEQNEKTQE